MLLNPLPGQSKPDTKRLSVNNSQIDNWSTVCANRQKKALGSAVCPRTFSSPFFFFPFPSPVGKPLPLPAHTQTFRLPWEASGSRSRLACYVQMEKLRL